MTRSGSALLGAVALLAAVGAASPAAADRVLRVDSTVDAVDADPTDGACRTAEGVCTLRAAVMEANAVLGADTIEVPAGRYVLTIPAFPQRGQTQENDAGNGDLDLSDTVVIRGAGARQTIVDADGTDRVFASQHRTVASLSDLTITGGRLDGSASGGGFWNLGTVTFDRVHLVDNEGAYGGAVFNSPLTHMVLRDSLVSHNRSGEGGGIRVDSSAEILNSTISGNEVVDGDQTRRPGELYGYGGGIDHRGGGDLTIVHSTITRNHALKGGGGVNSSQSYTPATDAVAVGTVRIRSSIIAGNTSLEGPRDCRTAAMVLLSTGHTLDGDGSCGTTGATDLAGLDPRLGPLANNGGPTDTHQLLVGSPALDAAAADGCPATDQRGVSRRQGAGCDIGAFELQSSRSTAAPRAPAAPPAPAPSAPRPVAGGRTLPATGGPAPAVPAAAAALLLVVLWRRRAAAP